MSEIPKRPSFNDKPVVKRALKNLLPEVMNWLGKENWQSEKEVLADLWRATSNGFHTDGYAIAKNLDIEEMWFCDTQLVEILDGLWGELLMVRDEAVAEWVKAYSIPTPFQEGDEVRLLREDLAGRVLSTYPEAATLTVCCPSLGHIREHPKDEQGVKLAASFTLGRVVGVEDVELRTPGTPVPKRNPAPNSEPARSARQKNNP